MKRFTRLQKLISMAISLILVLSLCLTAAPVSSAAESSVTTVWLNPSVASPFHNGEFQGWGTSLCWWANRLGYSEALTQQAVTAFFSDDGLGLDIARYNIGGGENPDHNHVLRSDSMVPGMWESYEWYNYNEAGGYHNDVRLTYDITNDQNQLNIAKAALTANPELYFEGFSNSAPYFMTYSWCTSGATNAWSNNLREEMYDDFARYIADCTKLLAEEGIRFQSYSPINEPTLGWGENTTYDKQEGCHFDAGASESNIIVETRRALDAAGLRDVLVASMDESSIDQSVANLDQLTTEARTALGRIDTHTYGGSQRAELKAKAQAFGKDLWMSEVDGDFKSGSGAMEGALGLAEHIILDMNEMQPAAWVMWNVVDVQKDSSFVDPNGNYSESGDYWYDSWGDECFSWYYPNSGLWGISLADHDTQELKLSQKYYGYGQFTRYIEPGDTIIASSAKTLAAYNKNTGDIKIVAINTASEDLAYQFDLSSFSDVGTEVEMIRTSGSLHNGEHWASISGEASLSGKQLTTTLKANSITTYIVKGNGPVGTIQAGSSPCGLYSIRSAVDGSYAIDISEKSEADGANAHLWSAGDGYNQLFLILPDNEGYYTIRALHSGKCLDVSAWGTADGTNVLQYARSGEDNQKWRAVQNADGTYTFISKHSGKALDLNEGKAVNGQNIQIWTDNGGNSQKWSLKPYMGLTEGTYKMRLQGTNFALNVSGNSMTSGANVQIWEGTNDDGNLWRISATADGYYSLRAVHSGMYLNASGCGRENGTNVIQWSDTTVQKNEKWVAVPNGDGSWCFLSACSGLVLDVANGKNANGTNVQLWTLNYSAAQRWVPVAGSNHSHIYSITTQEPTCTEQGFTAYTCTSCGVTYRDSYTEPLGHSWDAGVIDVAPTCTKSGVKCFTCVRCGATRTEAVPASGHTVVTDPAVAPAIGETGLTQGSHCSVCGTVLTAQKTVAALADVNYANLPSGVYTIANAADSSYQIDVSGQSVNSGVNVHLWSAHTANSQKWIFWNMGNGYYTIQNLNSGKYLDVCSASSTDGTNVWQYNYNGGDAQLWKIKANSDGTCTLVSKCGGKVLDLSNAQTSNGANLQLWTANGSSAQKWVLRPQAVLNSGVYTVNAYADTGYVLDVSGKSQSDSANVHIWERNGGSNQKFRVEAGGDGYYTVTATHSGKVLDVNRWGTDKGTNITQYTSNGGDNQKWLVIPYNGAYIFISKCNGLALDLSGGQTSNGTNIQCWTLNRTSAQLWVLTTAAE